MSKQETLRVAIDAEILPWINGGVAHAVQALLRALATLDDGGETYVMTVATREQQDYWTAQAGSNQIVVRLSDQAHRIRRAQAGALHRIGAALKHRLRPSVHALKRAAFLRGYWPDLSISDGTYESLGCHVMHFSWQQYILCSLPTIYNPHDLQHLHLPQFWPASELAMREKTYSSGCRFAQTVVVGSQWAKDDFVSHYGLDPRKVQVIPEGAQLKLAPTIQDDTRQEVRSRHQLPAEYFFYPAITWAHKNHIRLLEALAWLRDERGIKAALVCTGSKFKSFWPQIEARINKLQLQNQVQFLGFVSETDLRVIQQDALALIQTSLFEASSLPIFDAWLDGVPVACSNATALPQQVGDAGLLFDPLDVQDIARTLETIATSPETRRGLTALGRRRLQDFDWTRTARAYRAVYRRAAGFRLTEEDRWLLQWDWMREPNRTPTSSQHDETGPMDAMAASFKRLTP